MTTSQKNQGVDAARLGVAGLLLAFGCHAGRVEQARNAVPVRGPEPSTNLADAGSPPSDSCVDDAQCTALEKSGLVPEPEGKVVLCEAGRCEPYDEAVLWEWAQGISADLREFTLKPPKLSDASWFRPGSRVSLYVPENWQGNELKRRARCIALQFSEEVVDSVEEQRERLVAFVDDAGKQWPAGRRYGCLSQLELRETAVLYDPSCVTPTSSSGYGSARYVGQFLSRADDTGLVYDGAMAEITPYCSPVTLRRPGCDPLECHSCRIGLDVTLHVVGIGGRSNHRRELVRTVSDGTCPPCLPDPLRPLIPRLEAVLDGRTFYLEHGVPEALRLFRKKADCDAHVLALESGN